MNQLVALLFLIIVSFINILIFGIINATRHKRQFGLINILISSTKWLLFIGSLFVAQILLSFTYSWVVVFFIYTIYLIILSLYEFLILRILFKQKQAYWQLLAITVIAFAIAFFSSLIVRGVINNYMVPNMPVDPQIKFKLNSPL